MVRQNWASSRFDGLLPNLNGAPPTGKGAAAIAKSQQPGNSEVRERYGGAVKLRARYKTQQELNRFATSLIEDTSVASAVTSPIYLVLI